MKNFIVKLFSNRFGIVLATLNVCFFLSRPFFHRIFEHNHGENCFFSKHFFLFPMHLSSFESLMITLNLPSTILSLFSYSLTKGSPSDICVYTRSKFEFVFFTLFVILQWLFIAWLAKTVAAKIRQLKY